MSVVETLECLLLEPSFNYMPSARKLVPHMLMLSNFRLSNLGHFKDEAGEMGLYVYSYPNESSLDLVIDDCLNRILGDVTPNAEKTHRLICGSSLMTLALHDVLGTKKLRLPSHLTLRTCGYTDRTEHTVLRVLQGCTW